MEDGLFQAGQGINKWIAHMSKDDQKQGLMSSQPYIFIHTTKPLPFLAGQPNPSFLNKKDLHQTAQVGVKQGTLLPKLLILCILQRLPSC